MVIKKLAPVGLALLFQDFSSNHQNQQSPAMHPIQGVKPAILSICSKALDQCKDSTLRCRLVKVCASVSTRETASVTFRVYNSKSPHFNISICEESTNRLNSTLLSTLNFENYYQESRMSRNQGEQSRWVGADSTSRQTIQRIDKADLQLKYELQIKSCIDCMAAETELKGQIQAALTPSMQTSKSLEALSSPDQQSSISIFLSVKNNERLAAYDRYEIEQQRSLKIKQMEQTASTICPNKAAVTQNGLQMFITRTQHLGSQSAMLQMRKNRLGVAKVREELFFAFAELSLRTEKIQQRRQKQSKKTKKKQNRVQGATL